MEPSDNRLVFYERIPQLQDMAGFRVAINLTMDYWNRFTTINFEQEYRKKIYKTKSNNFIIPVALEEKIQKFVNDCCDEISFAVRSYNYVSYNTNEFTITVKEFLSYVVWKMNGQIDRVKTAFNLLNSTEVNEIVKFRVMCEFCMEEKIRRAWSELRDRSFIEKQTFYDDRLLVYWNCVMTGDFSKIIDNNVGSVEKILIWRLGSWPYRFIAVEYFFNRLNVDERIEIVARIKRTYCEGIDHLDANFLRFIIPKYTENEQYQLFSISSNIVRVFRGFVHSKSYDSIDDALKIWNHIKHFVNSDQYMEILRETSKWRNYADDELHMFVVHFLTEFWRATPSNLKEYMFQSDRDEFLLEFCIHPYHIVEDYDEIVQRDSKILITVLSDASVEYRKRVWSREWENIIDRSQPSSFIKILNVFLPYDEVKAFKKKATSLPCIREYFIKIIEVGKFSLLNEFLEILFDGRQCEIIDAKKSLFKENINMSYSIECCEKFDLDMTLLDDFIKVVFDGDTKAESEFKKEIILGCFCSASDCDCNSLVVMNGSERLCEGKLLDEVKNMVLKRCLKVFSNPRCNDRSDIENVRIIKMFWGDILKWCLGDSCDVGDFIEEKYNEIAKRIKLG